MLFLIAGLVLFLGAHSFSIVAPQRRDRLARQMGLFWQIAFSIESAIGLGLIIYGYGLARLDPVVLYTPPPMLRYAALVLMVIAMPLVLASFLPGRIRTAVKHPLLTAVKAWAFAHLLTNGTLADVLLFGGFLAWAVADRISLKRRTPRSVASLPTSSANDFIVIIAGVALTAWFLQGLHTWLIGIPIVLP